VVLLLLVNSGFNIFEFLIRKILDNIIYISKRIFFDFMKRLFYIDNLRIILIVLVVIAHAAITYGPVGFWYYYERTQFISTYVLTDKLSIKKHFQLGLFFLISASFIPSSIKRKGSKRFLLDRLRRLGIPLVFYIFIISPLIQYLHKLIIEGDRTNFIIFYYGLLKKGIIDMGPLWFLQVLLLFSISYAILNEVLSKLYYKRKSLLNFPSTRNIFITILILASLTFLIRIKFPIGQGIVNLSLGLAPQYIFLFGLGIMAKNNKWFKAINIKVARYWARIILIAVVFWPLFLLLSRNSGFNIEMFMGGSNWQSFIYAIWEAVLSISISISAIYFFRQKFNFQNKILEVMSKSTYFVFIIHSVVLIALSYSLKNVAFHPLFKFIIVALLSIILCFFIGIYVTKIRFLKDILQQ
jgi:fucose 4-O-acetylase-like acetyltransferase